MSDQFLRNIGQKIHALRKKQKLSIEELAYAADCNTSYFSQIENGRRNISVKILARIASALGVKPESLLADNCIVYTKDSYLDRLNNILKDVDSKKQQLILNTVQQLADNIQVLWQ